MILVICGGVGHSTELLYEAVASHKTYSALNGHIRGTPEARVFQEIGERWFGLPVAVDDAGKLPSSSTICGRNLRILIEENSTNCGANALETQRILTSHGMRHPRSIFVVQDPTMCRRTVASFAKAYDYPVEVCPLIKSWPTFVPLVSEIPVADGREANDKLASRLQFITPSVDGEGGTGVWGMSRFLDLVWGEMPRLRDDSNGYGPNGKGYIAHVSIPEDVEKAWRALTAALGANEWNSGQRSVN